MRSRILRAVGAVDLVEVVQGLGGHVVGGEVTPQIRLVIWGISRRAG
jgi:hypothetical protein